MPVAIIIRHCLSRAALTALNISQRVMETRLQAPNDSGEEPQLHLGSPSQTCI